MRILITILFIVCYHSFFSQKKIEDNVKTINDGIPPSPTAAAFTNYGFQKENLFEGKLKTDIPLVTFKSSDIDIPISAGYSSSGVKIDDINGYLGQSWAFNYGGIISRTINGKDDFTNNNYAPNKNYIDSDYFKFLRENYYNLNAFDYEYDIFSFNFLGNSGKFLLDEQDNVVLLTSSDIKIIKGLQGFIIIDDKGNKYYFEVVEKVKNIAGCYRKEVISTEHISSWLLNKIESPKGNKIFFEYADYSYSYQSTIREELKIVKNQDLSANCVGSFGQNSDFLPLGYTEITKCGPLNYYRTKVLKKISSNNLNEGEINFFYKEFMATPNNLYLDKIEKKNQDKIIEEVNLEYDFYSNKRFFLKKINLLNNKTSYEFSYINPDKLPERLSYSKDLWGYFNNASNGTLIQKNEDFYFGADRKTNSLYSNYGMLKNIIYPTKGYSEFEYEQNSYYGEEERIVSVYKKSEILTYDSPNVKFNEPYYSYTYTFNSGSASSDGFSKLFVISSNNGLQCARNFHINENPSMILSIVEKTTRLPVQLYTDLTRINPILATTNIFLTNQDGKTVYFKLNKNTDYDIEISAVKCLDVEYEIENPIGEIFSGNLDVGGVRIKSQTTFDNNQKNYKKYYYNTYKNKDKSSGDAGYDAEPIFSYNKELRSYCSTVDPELLIIPPCIFNYQKYLIYKSEPLISSINSGNNNIYYKYVSESLGGNDFEKGNIEHTFDINHDEFAYKILGDNLSIDDFGSDKWFLKSIENGNEIHTKIFDEKNESLLKQIDYNYVKKESEKVFNNILITELFNINTYCILWGNINITNSLSIRFWSYTPRINEISDITETEFFNGKKITTTKKFNYNNHNHYQLTSQSTSFPDGSIQTTNYQYAHEKNNQKLIDANMVSIPLETTTIKNGQPLSKVETIYPTSLPTTQTGNLLLPLSVQSTNINTISTTVPPAGEVKSIEVTYDKYDDKGNLLQYTTKSGIPTTLIWGYNNTQPIAKIEGATYGQVQNEITDIVLASEKDNNPVAYSMSSDEAEINLRNKLDEFRKKTNLSNYQITTYTYEPLIGVTSITPPSGIREIYQYDSANRLEKVVDVNGNILKEYQYNYKQ